MCEAKVTWRMGRKSWESCTLGQFLDDFRPGDEGKRGRGIAMRLGQEERTAFDRERSPLAYVCLQQAAGRLSVAHHALTSILGMLCLHADLSVGEVEIAHLKSDEFLAAQGPIVRHEQHHLIPKALAFQT